MSKVMGIFLSNFDFFYHAHSPNMVMSRDPRCKFRKCLFCPNSRLNIRKRYKISSGKTLYFRNYQPKTSRGVEGDRVGTPPPPVPLGLNIIKLFFSNCVCVCFDIEF